MDDDVVRHHGLVEKPTADAPFAPSSAAMSVASSGILREETSRAEIQLTDAER